MSVDYQKDPELDPRWTTRRSMLAGVGTTCAMALAGCLGSDDGLPEPIAIEDDHTCPLCNMVVVNHPGPAGHAYFPDDADVREQDGVVPYCASTCAYEHYFEQKELDEKPTVIYLTDYSRVDWDVYEEDESKFITAHLEADDHTDARELTYVVDSEVLGAMGESIIGFSDPDDADAFADEYGGEIHDHESLNRELVESLGFV